MKRIKPKSEISPSNESLQNPQEIQAALDMAERGFFTEMTRTQLKLALSALVPDLEGNNLSWKRIMELSGGDSIRLQLLLAHEDFLILDGDEIQQIERKDLVKSLRLCEGSDEVLAHLSQGFTNLTRLRIEPSDVITSHGIAAVRGLPLTEIEIVANKKVDDAGIEHLQEIKGLRSVLVQYCPVTAQCLRYLKDLGQLTSLSLRSCDWIMDAETTDILDFKRLERLDLSRCGRIGHHTLRHLRELKNLKCLDITNIGIGSGLGWQMHDEILEAKKDLRLHLPETEIIG